MELVPIVILTLKIVTALAVVVLGISYISFKIRQKSTPQKDFSSMQNVEIEKNFVQHVRKRLTHITREINLPIKKKENIQQKPIAKPKPEIQSKSKERTPRVEILKNQNASNNDFIGQDKKGKDLNVLDGDILEKYADEEKDKLFTLKADKKKPK
ncbi:MAG: hypothetical protein N2321_10750 [Melioribacteraceae bacterium]|nr:hypothetical protein [Melioribacteraceae bacterium]